MHARAERPQANESNISIYVSWSSNLLSFIFITVSGYLESRRAAPPLVRGSQTFAGTLRVLTTTAVPSRDRDLHLLFEWLSESEVSSSTWACKKAIMFPILNGFEGFSLPAPYAHPRSLRSTVGR
jgi:hypothetical protein